MTDTKRGRPILFRDDMVRALLEGRKTQTRRVVKPQPARAEVAPHCEDGWWMWRKWTPEHRHHDMPSIRTGDRRCPYGAPGDLLWVRETWCHEADGDARMKGSYLYRVSNPDAVLFEDGAMTDRSPWKPSIHMPRAASRLTLRVTGVRVERVTEISALDAQAEGVTHSGFRTLWDSMRAGTPFAWAANPWVWVVEFEVIRANVDEVRP